jgi:hypothetical protein
MPETANINGITWERQEDQGEREIWKVVWPLSTRFVLKDYGRHDASPEDEMYSFTGIRLAGGGPFPSVGRWTNMDRAMADVTGWLHDYALRQEVAMRVQADQLSNWRAEVEVPRKQRKVKA